MNYSQLGVDSGICSVYSFSVSDFFFFPPALGIFLSCIWGSIPSEIVKVLSPQISRPFFTEFAPLWHSFLKILVNSAPMKGTKPGGEGWGGGKKKKKRKGQSLQTLSSQLRKTGWLCLGSSSLCYTLKFYPDSELMPLYGSPHLFLFSWESQCCTAFCPMSEIHCLIYILSSFLVVQGKTITVSWEEAETKTSS